MFVIAYDMNVAEIEELHPKSCRQAYLDIEMVLTRYGFERVQ